MADGSDGWGGSNDGTEELGFRYGLENAMRRRLTTHRSTANQLPRYDLAAFHRRWASTTDEGETGMKQLSNAALAATAAVFLAASGAAAGDMSGLYGNTIVCTAPNGAATKVHVQAGGKYTVERDGKTIQGTWIDTGNQVCYTEVNPAPPADTKPICTSSALMKIGATWSVTDAGGNVDKCVLKEGNQ
jgi:hypothetical protein